MNEINIPAEQMTPAYVALCEKLGFKVVEAKPGKAPKRDPKKAALAGGVAVPPWAKGDPETYAEAKAIRGIEAKREKKLKPHWICETHFDDGNISMVRETEADARRACGGVCALIKVVNRGGKWVRA